MRPRYLPPPYQDAAGSGHLILRKETTAQIHLALPEDREALRTFLEYLSSESRQRHFFSASLGHPELLTTLCDNSDPNSVLTRARESSSRIVATSPYLGKDDNAAEVAFAADDATHGKGLGTCVLERLALLAVRHGFTRFWSERGPPGDARPGGDRSLAAPVLDTSKATSAPTQTEIPH